MSPFPRLSPSKMLFSKMLVSMVIGFGPIERVLTALAAAGTLTARLTWCILACGLVFFSAGQDDVRHGPQKKGYGPPNRVATVAQSSDSYPVKHYSMKPWGEVIKPGILRVVGLSVVYSEPDNPREDFSFFCEDFPGGGTSRWKYGMITVRPNPTKAVTFFGSDAILNFVSTACAAARGKITRAAEGEDQKREETRGELRLLTGREIPMELGGPSYSVAHGHRGGKQAPGTFSVNGLAVEYIEPGERTHQFGFPCKSFDDLVKFDGATLNGSSKIHVTGREFFDHVKDKTLARQLPSAKAVYEGMRDQCRAALGKEDQLETELAPLQAKRRAAEASERADAERRAEQSREATIAKQSAERVANFRDGILTALHAAEEPDPFSSIRGDFDLSGSDSRQWKTSLQLPDAERCALLKTAVPTVTAASAWTFGCLFRASGDGYEGMVKSLQSVLNLPYQPDEKAVKINQVFFADPSKLAWRLFVAKMTSGMIGVSLVAARVAGEAPTAVTWEAFAEVPTMLPMEPVVSEGTHFGSPGQMQTPASGAECETYQKGLRESPSREEDVRRVGTELSGLQLRYQSAMQQALESDQRASVSCSATTGPLGWINSMGCTAARITSQQKRAEAQSLQLEINRKQTQITQAQNSLLSSPRPDPPDGCSDSSGNAMGAAGTAGADQSGDICTRQYWQRYNQCWSVKDTSGCMNAAGAALKVCSDALKHQ